LNCVKRFKAIATRRLAAGCVACLCVVLASGCVYAVLDAPALLAEAPGAACLAEIAAFATQQTGRQVTLVPGAFSASDKLLLEPVLRRGPDGRPLDGRSRELPETFALVIDGGRCDVIHERTATRHTLAACACKPAR
jgi:hypothetical protein